MNRATRWGLAYVAGYAFVTVLGLVAKWLIEATSSVAYELHWFTTMPFIAFLFAYVLQKRWVEVAHREPEPAP